MSSHNYYNSIDIRKLLKSSNWSNIFISKIYYLKDSDLSCARKEWKENTHTLQIKHYGNFIISSLRVSGKSPVQNVVNNLHHWFPPLPVFGQELTNNRHFVICHHRRLHCFCWPIGRLLHYGFTRGTNAWNIKILSKNLSFTTNAIKK